MYLKTKIILIILVFWVTTLIYSCLKPQDLTYQTKNIEKILVPFLKSFNIGDAELSQESHEFLIKRNKRFEVVVRRYLINFDLPIRDFIERLRLELKKEGSRIFSWQRDKKRNLFKIELGRKRNKLYTLIFEFSSEISKFKESFPKLAKVAIVIDDFGYSFDDIHEWVGLSMPITISILPNLAFSKKIAQLAKAQGKELILHLPLEPHENEGLRQEPNTITTKMSKKEILLHLRKAIDSLPNLDGVSNHMGSKATENKKVMKIILRELKRKGLYFEDSVVTNKSVCEELAHKIGVRFAKRDIFIDNINEMDYIKKQLEKLAKLAQERGFAIGVGHARRKTLEALKRYLPELESQGIEFVFLSELVKIP